MLTIRTLVSIVLLSLIPGVAVAQQGKVQPYRFRVETKSKSRINSTVQARDYNEAVWKLGKRYPNSTILNFYPKKEQVKKRR